jgi:hypothetical protein
MAGKKETSSLTLDRICDTGVYLCHMSPAKLPPDKFKGYQFKFRLTEDDRDLLTGIASPIQWRLFCLGVANLLEYLKKEADKRGRTLEDLAVTLFTSPEIVKPLMMVLTDPDFEGLTDANVDEIFRKVTGDVT